MAEGPRGRGRAGGPSHAGPTGDKSERAGRTEKDLEKKIYIYKRRKTEGRGKMRGIGSDGQREWDQNL